MATNYGLDRQPTKLDYASPTQFKFGIVQLPKVEYFTTAANIPGIALADAIFPTPFKDIPMQGDKLTYNNLTIEFLVLWHHRQEKRNIIKTFFKNNPR